MRLRLQVSVFRLCVEAWTRFHGGEHIVTGNHGFRELDMQMLQEFLHSALLCLSAGVFGFPLSVKPALVANADAVLVVILAMCTHHLYGPASLYRTIPSHYVVIATAVLPSACVVPTVNLPYTTLLPRTNSTAMDDN